MVHGGAGGDPTRDAEYSSAASQGLASALEAGARLLSAGRGALDAVVAAVEVLEDCPVLNAGHGSVLNLEGEVEMDAAVMDGTAREAGAVAALRTLAHPVAAARAVLREGRHVLLVGRAAEDFAARAGLARVEPARLVTEVRSAQLARTVARRAREAQEARDAREARDAGATVGAVARDARGHLAAATSTGGMTAKHPGRVSDSALVGSGTWADDETCAISGTGHGELFIRAAFAHEVHALLRYAGLDLETACRRALAKVASLGGEGGCIAVDREGRVASPFDTPGMPRGLVRAGAPPRVVLASDEDLEA